jgi:hypothetical protein
MTRISQARAAGRLLNGWLNAPAAVKTTAYDPLKDFEPISLTGNTTFVFLIAPTVEAAGGSGPEAGEPLVKSGRFKAE